MPEGEGERLREGGGASSKLTYSCLGLRVWLTLDCFPVLEIGARGRDGRELGHPVGEEGCEKASPEEPAPGGTAGAERIVTDRVERWLNCIGRLCGGGCGRVDERATRPRSGSSSLSVDAGTRVCLA